MEIFDGSRGQVGLTWYAGIMWPHWQSNIDQNDASSDNLAAPSLRIFVQNIQEIQRGPLNIALPFRNWKRRFLQKRHSLGAQSLWLICYDVRASNLKQQGLGRFLAGSGYQLGAGSVVKTLRLERIIKRNERKVDISDEDGLAKSVKSFQHVVCTISGPSRGPHVGALGGKCAVPVEGW